MLFRSWLFSREVIDHTPELIDEPPIEHTSAVVNSWPAALKLLDENVWFMLRPLEVHVEFRKAIMDAVLERRGATGPGLSKWKALCEGPATPPTTHSP